MVDSPETRALYESSAIITGASGATPVANMSQYGAASGSGQGTSAVAPSALPGVAAQVLAPPAPPPAPVPAAPVPAPEPKTGLDLLGFDRAAAERDRTEGLSDYDAFRSRVQSMFADPRLAGDQALAASIAAGRAQGGTAAQRAAGGFAAGQNAASSYVQAAQAAQAQNAGLSQQLLGAAQGAAQVRDSTSGRQIQAGLGLLSDQRQGEAGNRDQQRIGIEQQLADSQVNVNNANIQETLANIEMARERLRMAQTAEERSFWQGVIDVGMGTLSSFGVTGAVAGVAGKAITEALS